MSRRDENPDCKLYVGGLEKDTTEQALEDAFSKYGRIQNVWISRDRPGFGFITFESADEADEALRNMNGKSVAGCTLKVELAGAGRRGGGGRGGFRGGRGGFGGGRGFGGDRDRDRDRDRFGGRGGGGGGGGCYNCGGSGHFARDCRQSNGGSRSHGGGGYGSSSRSGGGGGSGSYRRSDNRQRSRSPSFR